MENHAGTFTEEKQVQLHKGMVSLFRSELLQASYKCKFKRDPKDMIAELKCDIEEDDKGVQRLMEPSKWNIPRKGPARENLDSQICVWWIGWLWDGWPTGWPRVVGWVGAGGGSGDGVAHLQRFVFRRLHI